MILHKETETNRPPSLIKFRQWGKNEYNSVRRRKRSWSFFIKNSFIHRVRMNITPQGDGKLLVKSFRYKLVSLNKNE